MHKSSGAMLMLVCNAVTAFSYFCLTYQLFVFVKSSQVMTPAVHVRIVGI
jgi:hypothetical protein